MKKLLVVVDMQNDFVTGSLGSEEALKIIPRIEEIIRNWDGDIAFTRDTHKDEYLNTLEGKKLPVKHCIENTWGWEIIDILKKYLPNPKGMESIRDSLIGICYDFMCENGIVIINKPTFASLKLGELVRTKGYEEVTLVGVCTGICVCNNASVIRAFSPETNIVVVGDACSCVTNDTHNIALEAMKTYQVDVV